MMLVAMMRCMCHVCTRAKGSASALKRARAITRLLISRCMQMYVSYFVYSLQAHAVDSTCS